MSETIIEYDVFISYAREDGKWVKEHLYDPMLRCRLPDGRMPRVFMDVGELGIRPGENFLGKLATAIQHCHKFVAVYSVHYFIKQWCVWERQQAFKRDPVGEQGIYVPILKDDTAAGQVPPEVALINYPRVSVAGWFEQLCDSLDLQPVNEVPHLYFEDEPPAGVYIERTLPPIRAVLRGESNRPVSLDGVASLRADNAEVHGTVLQPMLSGVVIFDDLFFAEPVAETRLIVEVPGCIDAISGSFTVLIPPKIERIQPPPDNDVFVPAAADQPAAFLAVYPGGRAVVAVTPTEARLYHTDGSATLKRVHSCELHSPVRLWRCIGDMFVMALWDGAIEALWSDGRLVTWRLGTDEHSIVVPGALEFGDDGTLYVGLWSGLILRLHANGEAQPFLRHKEGVQALAVNDDRVYVVGFDGALHVYFDGRRMNGALLEPTVHLLHAIDSVIIGCGERKFYQIEPRPFRVLSEPSPLPDTRATFVSGSHILVIAANGQGLCLDKELTILKRFRAAAGAIPVAMDQGDHWHVFCNPDASYSLLRDNRMVFTQQAGPLAVAPSGDIFALGDETGFRLINEAHLQALLQGGLA